MPIQTLKLSSHDEIFVNNHNSLIEIHFHGRLTYATDDSSNRPNDSCHLKSARADRKSYLPFIAECLHVVHGDECVATK